MQIHLLAFEGPDPYARIGGLASRIDGLTHALEEAGHETHLWFVGDARLPAHERRGERLHLHRWCQWLSAHHPRGTYDGEHAKEQDYSASLPPHLFGEHVLPALARGERVVVLAEEWQTAHAMLHLDWLLRQAELRERVTLFWNANNVFGFEQIPWERLARAVAITTVSRYMRQRMAARGVDAIVIPNGLGPESYAAPAAEHVRELGARLHGRTALAKVARWDPDKRWFHAVGIAADLRGRGWQPLLVARGGLEPHGTEVLARARALGLRVEQRPLPAPGAPGLLDVLQDTQSVDLLLLASHLDAGARQLLLHAAQAVLANSGHEPFGLVGLETMAAGGLACVGGTGEDYAVPGRNSLLLQSEDPREFTAVFEPLRRDPRANAELRRAGEHTARAYEWSGIVARDLLPRLAAFDAETTRSAPGPRRTPA